MTRKDYVALAAALASVRPDLNGNRPSEAEQQWTECVGAISRACKADNARFDPTTFALACLATP